MGERVYKAMSRFGGGSIAMGVIVMVVGITTGVLMIVGGARMLKEKSNIMF